MKCCASRSKKWRRSSGSCSRASVKLRFFISAMRAALSIVYPFGLNKYKGYHNQGNRI